MKTYSPKPRDIERRWYVLDASGAVLGRLATQAASILRGKHKPIYAPHADTGDHVIVINAKDVTLSGGKENKKVAYHHSGHPGGLTETVYSRLLATKPAFAVEKAIKGMLPHNRLGRQMATKLRVYPGADHRHEAQKPQPLGLGEVPPWEGLPIVEGPAPTHPEPKPPAAKRPTAKRTTAKASTTSPVKKTTAKRSTPKASTAKKSTAKRTTAKRTTGSSSTKKPTARRTKKKES
jgi:large subunit ribosomal protein L13